MSRYDRLCTNVFDNLKNYCRNGECVDIYHCGYMFSGVHAFFDRTDNRRYVTLKLIHQNQERGLRPRLASYEIKQNCDFRYPHLEVRFRFPGYYQGLCDILNEECYKSVAQFHSDAGKCSVEQTCRAIFERMHVIISERLIKEQMELYIHNWYHPDQFMLLELDHKGRAVPQKISKNTDEYVTIQQPCDTVLEDEPLSTYKIIHKDDEFFDFYLRVAKEQDIQPAGGHYFPTIISNGIVKTIPSFYIYLIAVNLTDDGNRYMTVGVLHWLLGIYAEVDIDYRIYPQPFETYKGKRGKGPIYLPCVTFGHTDFSVNFTVGRDTLTVAEAKDFVSGIVDTLITHLAKQRGLNRVYSDVVQELELEHGLCVSNRLMQIMLYHHHLVWLTQDWILENCGCARNDQICFCSIYTPLDIIKCRKLYFKDAGLLVSNEVYFATT
ncbi:Hypothetical predicted protein [Paramuricea clavata]|uniref:Uncharacterized protein n=1 Tax=Paramuricea clavata TaxID=317549 RepID=A0A7D9D623_PARCT|nr:Hypothetical predicted protein [Paramuricea clavata]